MNEIFNFKRFWTYFKYDLKQMMRNHSKAAILIGGASAIFYVVWVLISLVFAQQWSAPPIIGRAIVFYIAFAVLIIYLTRVYGHLTDKRAGSSWLMIPASRTEKFVSMLLIILVVIPVLFLAVYFLLDGFLSLVDPTYGEALITGAAGLYTTAINFLTRMGEESPILLTPTNLIFPTVISFFCNCLYFLLCGICFKKNKIVGAFAILFGLSLVSSLLTGLLLPNYLEHIQITADEERMAQWIVNVMNVSVAFTCLLTAGLGWGVWRRIKTIQH